MKKYKLIFICSFLSMTLASTASANDNYRRQIHLNSAQYPYMYMPTDNGIYSIRSAAEITYNPVASSPGRYQPKYMWYPADYPIKDVISTKVATFTAVTSNRGDNNLLLLIEKSATTDVTPDFITKGSNSCIEQIEMQWGEDYGWPDERNSVYITVRGDHAGVYMHPRVKTANKYYPEWTKIFDGEVNFISTAEENYELVICYNDTLGNSRVVVSADSGKCAKWSEIYSTDKFKIINVEHDGDFYCVYGENIVSVSTDGGGSWTESRPPFLVSDILYEYPAVYAAEASDTISRMWRSDDFGVTWNVYRTIPTDPTGIVDMCYAGGCASSFVMYTGSGNIYSLPNYYGQQDEEILFNGTPTDVKENIEADDIEVYLASSDAGLWVSISVDVPQWSATLYNSNGICVAQKTGEGSEIFLSADSEGTHILVVKAGGRVVKKKIAIK